MLVSSMPLPAISLVGSCATASAGLGVVYAASGPCHAYLVEGIVHLLSMALQDGLRRLCMHTSKARARLCCGSHMSMTWHAFCVH